MSKRLVATVGPIKVYRDSEWQEYVCVDTTSLATYHTDDKQDALDTAKIMAKEV